MNIGRKIYYELATGNVILDTGERLGSVVATTVDQDIATFTALSERNRNTFDVIELPFGAYAQDFAECNGYSVDVATKTLKFSYPDPSAPSQEPVYQTPLTDQIADLKTQLQTTQDAVDFLLMGGM
jgi:replication fork clamp-binding protein CrfC